MLMSDVIAAIVMFAIGSAVGYAFGAKRQGAIIASLKSDLAVFQKRLSKH